MKTKKIIKNGVLAILVFAALSHSVRTICVEDSQKNNRSWFPFATITQVWNTIKNGLGLTTNFTGFLTGPKKPQATVTINPRIVKPHLKKINYPYTASMAHLTQMVPQKDLLLTPKPSHWFWNWKTEKWFWNDGVFTDSNKTTYQVTHKGVNYCYAYNKNNKCWEPTGKNRMDYLTYYDYLLKNNQDLEPFVRHLVTEMANSCTNKPKRYITPLTKAILNEEKHNDSYVFYTGCKWTADYWRDLVSALHSSLEGKKVDLERSSLEPCAQYDSAEEFFKKEYNYACMFDDKKSANLMSANVAAFGNFDILGESSLWYFLNCRNYGFSVDMLKESYTKLFKSIGLTSYTVELDSLLEKYSYEAGGLFKQTFIVPTQANKYAYPSLPFGYPRKFHEDDFTKSITKEIIKKGLAQNTDTALTIEAFLGLLRTDPKNKCFKINGRKPDNFKKSNPSINTMQARLFHTSSLFTEPDMSGSFRKTAYIYASEKDKQTHEKLREEMFKLMDQIVKDARENGTLKI